jgi:hypothetical protein
MIFWTLSKCLRSPGPLPTSILLRADEVIE